MKFFKKTVFALTLGLLTTGGALTVSNNNVNAKSKMKPVYDLSEWQHQINNKQAKKLRKESSFVILRAQYGGTYSDKALANNAKMMQKHKIPYGVYSYSLYANKHQMKKEAKDLYHKAPKAKFYVNDLEQSSLNKGKLNKYTKDWSKTVKKMSNRPTVLYSGLYYMNGNITNKTRKNYNAIWLANYSKVRPTPNYHYDLWQYTNSYHSKALGESIDASVIPKGGKPLSFWTGNNKNNTNNSTKKNKKNNDNAQNNSGDGTVIPSNPSDNDTTNNQNNNQNSANNDQNSNQSNDVSSQISFPSAPSDDY